MPGFLPSEVKTYQYAANIVYDELIDKYGMGKLKNININKLRQAVELAKSKGLTPAKAAETVYNSAERHVQGVKKMANKTADWKAADAAAETKAAIKARVDARFNKAYKAADEFKAKAAYETKASVEKAASKLGKFGKITGGLALATALIYGSYEVYKRYLSAAAKACAHRSGNDRKECIDRYRSNARKEQIKKLHSHLQDCQKSKDPMSCKKTILIKIQKISKRVK